MSIAQVNRISIFGVMSLCDGGIILGVKISHISFGEFE